MNLIYIYVTPATCAESLVLGDRVQPGQQWGIVSCPSSEMKSKAEHGLEKEILSLKSEDWKGMVCQQHPPNSPDLNPIENIWCHMQTVIAKDSLTSHREGELMMRIVQNLWDSYADEKWDGLIASMPDRMQAVMDAKGGSTKY